MMGALPPARLLMIMAIFFLSLESLGDQIDRIVDHSMIQHPVNEFVERKGLCIGVFILHSKRSDQADKTGIPGIGEPPPFFRETVLKGAAATSNVRTRNPRHAF